MKEIYIVLTSTGTWLSKIIKKCTRTYFSHISISLDAELNKMYSFGRTNVNNPFSGGFVHERIERGVFKKFTNTDSMIYSLKISDYQYKKIEKILNEMESEKEKYKYNILGLFIASFNVKVRFKYAFYCSEFVKYIFEVANITKSLPDIVTPEDLGKFERLDLIYSGLIKDYKEFLNNEYSINSSAKNVKISC